MFFRASRICLSKSSKQWISRQNRDPYVKKRQSDPFTYRSRSAYKLIEIDDAWESFLSKRDVRAVVDLGAAPGGWSQVVARKLGYQAPERGKPPPLAAFDPLNIDDVFGERDSEAALPVDGRGTIIAVDLLRMEPIHGVHSIVGDFLDPQTSVRLRNLLGGHEAKVDIILSDMAANASGNETADIQSSLRICEAVLQFAKEHLRSAESTGRKKGGVILYVCITSRCYSVLMCFQDEVFCAS